jgi:hypothetical protein
MAKIGTMSVQGKSGTVYAFGPYSIGTDFKALGAVYVITKRTAKLGGSGSHKYLYVDETGDLSTRFNDHHKQECFDEHGANCIGIHLDGSDDSRLSKESDILNAHDWPCND